MEAPRRALCVKLDVTNLQSEESFGLLQDTVFPQFFPLQVQVADPSHEPASFACEVPTRHPNFTDVLHTPFTRKGAQICSHVG